MNMDKESLELVHVITPGDHFSPRTGSAVPTVVHGLSIALNYNAVKSSVVVDSTTYKPRYESCNVLEVKYNLAPVSKAGKVMDVLTGALFNSRRHVAGRYQPVRTKLESCSNATIVYHNTLAPCAKHKSQNSSQRVYSWWHNDLSRTLTNRELCHYIDRIDGVICCSHFLRTLIIRRLPCSLSRKVHVVQNGVILPSETSHSRVMSERPTIGFVGRVTPEKGVHLILEAIASNEKIRNTCDLLIVGNHGFSAADPLTAYEVSLRTLASKSKLSARFLPFQNRFDIAKVYEQVDVLVVPSVFPEPFGLVVLEANSYGIPVIHAHSGGLLEASGGIGLVFDKGDYFGLANKLDSLLFDTKMYATLSQKAYEWARMSSWENRAFELILALGEHK